MAGVRAPGRGDGKGPGTIVGYAAVFERFSQDLGDFYEKIQRGAFASCLGQDVQGPQEPRQPTISSAARKSGTLRMDEDELGLRVEIDLPDTQTRPRCRRGDPHADYLDGMSFSFTTDVDQWDYSGDTPIGPSSSSGPSTMSARSPSPPTPIPRAAMRSIEARNRSQATPPPAAAAGLRSSLPFRLPVPPPSRAAPRAAHSPGVIPTMPKACELRAKHAVLIDEQSELAKRCETEKRAFTADEQKRSDEVFRRPSSWPRQSARSSGFEANDQDDRGRRQAGRRAPPSRDRGGPRRQVPILPGACGHLPQ